tara:strand:- start:498 stop:1055 length:558 start_codon:yes stop_codon:yes gene_type:complete
MIKILPITLIPLFFFIFYFNVIFLTDSNLPEIENLEVKSKSEKKLINKENENISAILDENQNRDQLNKNINMKSNNQSEKLEKADINKKVNDGNFVKNTENTDTNDTTKRTRVQFGAFNSEKNLVNLEMKLAKIFKEEFGDDFGSFLVLKDKKYLKLILSTNSVEYAKKICNFSKKNNINCLIIN